MKVKLPILLIPCLFLAACEEPEDIQPVDKQQVLLDVATKVIVPTYVDLAETTQKLETATQALCDAPSETSLLEAQNQWRNVRPALKASDSFNFGPFKDLRVRSALEWWPADYDRVEAAISAAPSPVTSQYLLEIGADQRGLFALEYLLFGLLDDEVSALEQLEANPLRCAFAVQAASVGNDKAEELVAGWGQVGDGNYADQFSRAGVDSEIYTNDQQAIDELVNFMIFAVENAADIKLGVPLGQKSGGSIQLDDVQGGLSANALSDLQSTLDGFEQSYLSQFGEDMGASVADLVAERNEEVDQLVHSDLAAARSAINEIPAPLTEALVKDIDSVQRAYDALKELQRTLSVDVAGVLGVTLTFNDNDGD